MGFLGRGFEPHIHHNKLFQIFPIHDELEKYSPRYTQEMKRLGYLTGPPGISGRPAIPPFQERKSVTRIRLSLGKLLVKLTFYKWSNGLV